MTGAALAVAGVALGIGAILSLTDSRDPDPLAESVSAQVEAPTPAGPVPADPVPADPAPADAAPADPAPAHPDTAPVHPAPAEPLPPAPAVPMAPVPPAPSAPAAVRTGALPAGPPLTVLNNSRLRGLEDRAAEEFRAGGWPVADVGGLGGRIRATTVYYDAGQRADAERLAQEYGLPRVLPRLPNLPGTGLTVVVTRDWRG